MPSLEARVLALEGGPRRGGCMICEFDALNRRLMGLAPGERGGPCGHPPFDFARELAALNAKERAMKDRHVAP